MSETPTQEQPQIAEWAQRIIIRMCLDALERKTKREAAEQAAKKEGFGISTDAI